MRRNALCKAHAWVAVKTSLDALLLSKTLSQTHCFTMSPVYLDISLSISVFIAYPKTLLLKHPIKWYKEGCSHFWIFSAHFWIFEKNQEWVQAPKLTIKWCQVTRRWCSKTRCWKNQTPDFQHLLQKTTLNGLYAGAVVPYSVALASWVFVSIIIRQVTVFWYWELTREVNHWFEIIQSKLPQGSSNTADVTTPISSWRWLPAIPDVELARCWQPLSAWLRDY